MSASETNIENQTRRHIGPLAGMALGVAFVGVLYFGYVMTLAEEGQTPIEASDAPVAASDVTGS